MPATPSPHRNHTHPLSKKNPTAPPKTAIQPKVAPDSQTPEEKCKEICGCHLVSRNGYLLCAQPYKPGDTTPLPAVPATTILDYPHVCPQNFRNLADWTYAWAAEPHQEKTSVPMLEHVVDCIREGAIVYVRGWEVDDFFRVLYPQLKRSVVLLTGDSDLSVPAPHHMAYVTGESKILHWFGQNGDLSHVHDAQDLQGIRFTAIPIGLNCKEQSRFLSQLGEHVDALRESLPSEVHQELLEFPIGDPIRRFPHQLDASILDSEEVKQDDIEQEDTRQELKGSPKKAPTKEKLLLINFDPTTDPTGTRSQLWDMACTRGEWSDFADCHAKERGVKQYEPQMVQIYARNLRYKFWLSPRGNGLDCHRTWEALYTGRIPVVSFTPVDPLLKGLPVLVVEDWSVMSREFLETKYAEMMEKHRKGEYSFDKLLPSYWSELVLSKSAYASMKMEERPGRCWSPQAAGTSVATKS